MGDCIGKDGCNSVTLECKAPSQCSVTCTDGKPACNSLTVTAGVAVSCSPDAACNSVESSKEGKKSSKKKKEGKKSSKKYPKAIKDDSTQSIEYLHAHASG